jgi:hypothetical protein
VWPSYVFKSVTWPDHPKSLLSLCGGSCSKEASCDRYLVTNADLVCHLGNAGPHTLVTATASTQTNRVYFSPGISLFL